MYTILLVIEVIVSLAIIGLVFLQHGKGADAGAAFGSGASGTVFGARGASSFLSRATAIASTIFFITSLSLAYLVSNAPGEESIVTEQLSSDSLSGPDSAEDGGEPTLSVEPIPADEPATDEIPE